MGDINKLAENKWKRDVEGTHPVYLVIKRTEQEKRTRPGPQMKEHYPPMVIWAETIEDILSWIDKSLVKAHRPARTTRTMKVENAREASELKEEDYMDNRDIRNLSEIVENLKCVVVFY